MAYGYTYIDHCKKLIADKYKLKNWWKVCEDTSHPSYNQWMAELEEYKTNPIDSSGRHIKAGDCVVLSTIIDTSNAYPTICYIKSISEKGIRVTIATSSGTIEKLSGRPLSMLVIEDSPFFQSFINRYY